jgi:hypothetical protein
MAMTNEPADVGAQQRNQPSRSTSEGRKFGSISYAADEQEQVEDLRRRPSVKIPHVTGEHWMDLPARSTGSRKSVS